MNDLLLRLLNLWIGRNYPPDILSIEYPDESPVIRVEWFSGKKFEFGYTKTRWDAVWERFNEFWQPENTRDADKTRKPEAVPGKLERNQGQDSREGGQSL